MLSPLTKRQKEIFDYINLYIQINGISPSLEEIRKHFNLKAVSTVHEHIDKLKKKGYLSKEMNQARGITTHLDQEEGKLMEVNILGEIAAGEPIEAVENPETMFVSKDIVPGSSGDYFVLKVRGESMIDAGILDKDLVLIRSQNFANNGDTVVAIVEDNSATLKKYYWEKTRVRLQPANEKLEPMYYDQVEIRGKVVALLRQY